MQLEVIRCIATQNDLEASWWIDIFNLKTSGDHLSAPASKLAARQNNRLLMEEFKQKEDGD